MATLVLTIKGDQAEKVAERIKSDLESIGVSANRAEDALDQSGRSAGRAARQYSLLGEAVKFIGLVGLIQALRSSIKLTDEQARAIDRVGDKVDEVRTRIGGEVFGPAINKSIAVVEKAADALIENWDIIASAVNQSIADVVGSLATLADAMLTLNEPSAKLLRVLDPLFQAAAAVNPSLKGAAAAMSEAREASDKLFGELEGVVGTLEELEEGLRVKANDALTRYAEREREAKTEAELLAEQIAEINRQIELHKKAIEEAEERIRSIKEEYADLRDAVDFVSGEFERVSGRIQDARDQAEGPVEIEIDFSQLELTEEQIAALGQSFDEAVGQKRREEIQQLALAISNAFGPALGEAGDNLAQLAAGVIQLIDLMEQLAETTTTMGAILGGIGLGQGVANIASGLGILDERQSETASVTGPLFGGIGAGIGAAFGSPQLGALAGSLFGSLVGGLFPGSTPFAAGAIRGQAGGGVGIEGLRANDKGDLDAARQFIETALTSINEILDIVGAQLEDVIGGSVEIQRKGDEWVVNIGGIQTTFQRAEDAMAFFVSETIRTGELSGASAEVLSAIKQSAAENRENMEGFLSDVQDIAAIMEALEPQVPEPVRRLRDAWEETKRLSEQAARFGLDASGVWDRFNTELESFQDSLSRTAILASAPVGQGVEAMRSYFEDVVRPMVFAFNRMLREIGRPEEQIDLSTIDAIQRGAVSGERQRAAERRQQAFERADESVQSTTRSFLDLAGQLDPFDEQLRQVTVAYEAALEAAEEQGIETDRLTAAYNAATEAIESNRAEADRLRRQQENEQRVQDRLRRRGSRADVFGFAAEVFERMGDAERAANLRAKQEFLLFKIAMEETRLRIAAIAAEGKNVDALERLFGEIVSGTQDWTWEDFVVPVVDAAEGFRSVVQDAATSFSDRVDAVATPFEDFFAQSIEASRPEGLLGDIQEIVRRKESLPNLGKLGGLGLQTLVDRLNTQFGFNIPDLLVDFENGQPVSNRPEIEAAIMALVDQMQEAEFDRLAERLLEPFTAVKESILSDPRGPVSKRDQLLEAQSDFARLVTAFESGDITALEGGSEVLERLRELGGDVLPENSDAFKKIQKNILDFVDDLENADLGDLLQKQAETTQKTEDELVAGAIFDFQTAQVRATEDVGAAVSDLALRFDDMADRVERAVFVAAGGS